MFTEDSLLENHLRHDVYPPIESESLKTAMKFCRMAITAVVDGKSGKTLCLPSGVVQTAGELVDGLNLDGFVSMRIQESEDAG